MLAFVFPGQGAQKVGMGQMLSDGFAVAREIFEQADAALGFSLSELCFSGPDERLKLTAYSQPAILTVSVAVLRVLEQEFGAKPELVAGHSLGEYSALVAAGALAFEDAVKLVHLRGRYMQEAVAEGVGTMAAVMGLEAAVVREICDSAAGDQVVSPANFNGGKQVVIGGHAAAVERAMAEAKQRGGRAMLLRVSAPFHCSLMQPAADKMAEALNSVAFQTPRIPVIRNVDAERYEDASEIPQKLVQQIVAPVLWEETVTQMAALGTTHAVELGPGRVLCGLMKRIVGDAIVTANVETPDHVRGLNDVPWLIQ